MRKRDNRGSTIVLVLVVIACIGIMAGVAVAVSLGNFQMKKTDEGVKASFYSAEGVFDEVRAKLQEDISDAYYAALTKTLQNYTKIANNQKDRQKYFQDEYYKELKRKLGTNRNETDSTYKLETLQGYVAQELTDNIAENKFPYASFSYPTSPSNMQVNAKENGLELKNLSLKFVDSKGFTSYITTNLLLKVPDVKFVEVAGVPDVLSYTIIGNKGVHVNGIPSLQIKGNVYSGSEKAAGLNPALSDDSFVLENSKVFFDEKNRLISDGKALIKGASGLSVVEKSDIWSGDIILDSGYAKLEGSTYVADDMILDGTNPSVSFGGTAGRAKYIGFGQSTSLRTTDGDSGSAILINGKNSILDMSGLKKLSLGGYAYVGTKVVSDASKSSGGNDGINIRTGESISVKNNQTAYIMPAEWIGVDRATDKSKYQSNPLRYSEYQDIKGDAFTEVASNVKSKILKKTFAEIVGSGNINDYITRIFVPGGNAVGEGLVYYYINLPHDKAGAYFKEAYAKNEGLSGQTSFFAANIVGMPDTGTSIKTAGGYTIKKDSKFRYFNDQRGGSGDLGISKDYEDIFTALRKRLIIDKSNITQDQLNKNVYHNIVDDAKLSAVLSKGGSPIEIGDSDFKAKLVNGDYNYSSSDIGCKLIVARGNVNVNSNFEGTIIAGGKVTVTGTSEIKRADRAKMKRLLNTEIPASAVTNDVKHLYDIFVDGSVLAGDDTSGGGSLADERAVKLTELVDYKNWSKH